MRHGASRIFSGFTSASTKFSGSSFRRAANTPFIASSLSTSTSTSTSASSSFSLLQKTASQSLSSSRSSIASSLFGSSSPFSTSAISNFSQSPITNAPNNNSSATTSNTTSTESDSGSVEASGTSGGAGTDGIEGNDESEAMKKRRRTNDADPPPPPDGNEENGEELPKKDPKRTAFAVSFFGIIFGGLVFIMGQPDPLNPNSIDPNENIILGYFRRAFTSFTSMFKTLQEPVSAKLLPDPLPEPYQCPYTLVLSLDDLLVHSEWDTEHGWKIAKRPGVDFFLAYMAQFFEIVVFANGTGMNAQPIIEKLNQFGYISYALYREAAKYEDGQYVKDLSYLNRDISKVVIMDTDANTVKYQPENAIVLPPWTGDANDRELFKFVEFLESFFFYNIQDTRNFLKLFEGKYIPTAFKEWQQRRRQELEQERQSSRQQQSWVMRLFSKGVTQNPAMSDINPMDLIESKKLEVRQDFVARLPEHKQQVLAQRQREIDENERILNEMKKQKTSMWDWMTTGQEAMMQQQMQMQQQQQQQQQQRA